ncbi:MAG: M16 family metallopeptidase [Ktedonobacterales bacterium]
MPSVRSVSIGFFFTVGSRYEASELSGVSHLIEHMLFKGSEQFPTAQAISEAIEGVGGLLDAGTDKELTVYSAKIASKHFELAIGLMADMVRHPRFEPAELDKERRVIIEELGMYRDSPADWVSVLGDEMFWPDLPLGREVAGTRETVESISRAAMADYWTRHYVPGSLVVSIVGDVTHERALEATTRLLGDWQPAPTPPWQPSPPPSGVARVRLETRKTEQTNFCLYTPGLPHRHDDDYALSLLHVILGDGMSSRLFQEVRERQGLAYDVGTAPVHFHDTGAFVVSAGVEPRRTEAALTAILAELARIHDVPVSAAELHRAKEYSKGRMALRLEDTSSVASWLGGQEALLNEIHELDETMARLDAVTVEDIQHVARALFTDEWLRLAVIGPNKHTEKLEQVLHL